MSVVSSEASSIDERGRLDVKVRSNQGGHDLVPHPGFGPSTNLSLGRSFQRTQKGAEIERQFRVTCFKDAARTQFAQQALTDCVIYTCDFASLTNLYDECQDLERFARKIAEHYFLEKEKKEIEIVLLDASQRYILFKEEFPTLEQLISQFHIASYLGISATQLSRIRKQFLTK